MVMIKNFLPNRQYEKEVKCLLEKVEKLCDEANKVHNSLMVLMSNDEREKQQPWFSAGLLMMS